MIVRDGGTRLNYVPEGTTRSSSKEERRMRSYRWLGGLGLSLVTLLIPSRVHGQPVAHPGDGPPTPIAGTTANCDNFRVALLPFGLISFDIADEGWTWVEPAGRRFRSASGLVTGSKIASNDTPANHESHDHNTQLLLDPGQEGLLSVVGGNAADDPRLPPELERAVDTLEIEWETGIRPSEKSGDGANPMFPKWAWPSVGDRVWTDGHWIFDCGHATEEVIGTVPGPIAGTTIPITVNRYRTEIHPARALASMRDQARKLPGSGNAPVPVTATDLYIHGRGGFVVDQLNCGMGIIVDGVGGSGDPDACPEKTSPIDVDFSFDICVPPRPLGSAALTWVVEAGPGNTVGVPPVLQPVPAAGACLLGDQFDHGEMLRATVPLLGTGVTPESVYARKIDAGWVGGSPPPLRRFRVTLNQMDLHNDHDPDPGDGELSFFWMNINRAGDNEWIRLADFANGNMNDYDDDGGFGDGEMSFSGASFDFFVREGQDFTVRAGGYEQDCYDDHFGDHELSLLMYVGCHANPTNTGGNDDLKPLPSALAPDATRFGVDASPEYGVGSQDLKALYNVVDPFSNPPALRVKSEYELEITIQEIFDNTPPTTTASPSPVANAAGWNKTNVTVGFLATDNPGGSGVAAMVLSATGAQTFDMEVAGGSASVDVIAEGVTTITHYARDQEGNVEAPNTLVVRIDRTPPTITGTRAPGPNQHGWNNTDVVVSFTCGDLLSGVAGCGATPQVVSTEGLGQSRSAEAVDLAGNTVTATVGGINIDKTPPVIAGLPAQCALWPPSHQLVVVGTATVTDALSGLEPGTFAVTGTSNEPVNGPGDGNTSPDVVIEGTTISLRAERAGGGGGRVYTLGGSAQDLAGNVANAAATCSVMRAR